MSPVLCYNCIKISLIVLIRQLYNVGAGQLAVTQDLGQQTAPDQLAAMDGYDCAATVRMAQEEVAPLDTYELEAQAPGVLINWGPLKAGKVLIP